MSKKLYVGNLSFSATSDDLVSLFGQYGQVVSAQIVIDRETGRSRGFAFVEMATAEEAEDEAVEAYAKVTESYLPLPVRQVLTSQAAHIEKSHEFVKAARDTKK